MSFHLHPRLRQDCLPVGRFPLSLLLLMDDSRFPWCVLVPRRAGIGEAFQLDWPDQVQLARESAFLSSCMSRLYRADKMNVAAIGNMVPQLHIHHVARFRQDAAWPSTVWGAGERVPYTGQAGGDAIDQLLLALGTEQAENLRLLPV